MVRRWWRSVKYAIHDKYDAVRYFRRAPSIEEPQFRSFDNEYIGKFIQQWADSERDCLHVLLRYYQPLCDYAPTIEPSPHIQAILSRFKPFTAADAALGSYKERGRNMELFFDNMQTVGQLLEESIKKAFPIAEQNRHWSELNAREISTLICFYHIYHHMKLVMHYSIAPVWVDMRAGATGVSKT